MLMRAASLSQTAENSHRAHGLLDSIVECDLYAIIFMCSQVCRIGQIETGSSRAKGLKCALLLSLSLLPLSLSLSVSCPCWAKWYPRKDNSACVWFDTARNFATAQTVPGVASAGRFSWLKRISDFASACVCIKTDDKTFYIDTLISDTHVWLMLHTHTICSIKIETQ